MMSDDNSQQVPSGLQRVIDHCRYDYLHASDDASPVTIVGQMLEEMPSAERRHFYDLLITHRIPITLSGHFLGLTPDEANKLFLRNYIIPKLMEDKQVRDKVLAGPHADSLPVRHVA